ncbi:SAUGI family uracil-DNA glycosylase inhibitor [Staphylococcus haemolyticus]|uniref:SAUGI family uracil-DNA glycosylase inhibitor n=1 Tax=Staphylococcus haemolyticus TaxID=1283 RepID=UPI003C12FE15
MTLEQQLKNYITNLFKLPKDEVWEFFMPKFNFVINITNENRIENLSLSPFF